VTAVARVFLLVSGGTWWQKPCLEACDKKKKPGKCLANHTHELQKLRKNDG